MGRLIKNIFRKHFMVELNNRTLALIGLFFVLLIVIVVLFIRSETNAAAAERSEVMGAVLVEHLKNEGYTTLYPECRGVSPTDADALRACLRVIVDARDLTKLFAKDEFKNVDAVKGTLGYLVIKNAKGGKSFASANFTLNYNNVPVANGCSTPGDIAPGYTCRFNFNTTCAPGDNLEVKYDGQRVFLHTC